MTLNFDLSSTQNLNQIIKCIQLGYLPEVSSNENNLDDHDGMFLAHLETAKSILKQLDSLLSRFLKNEKCVGLEIKIQDILNPCLYLCGEHNRSNLPWSDVESHSLMSNCTEKLCNIMHYVNIEELFINEDISKVIVGLHCKLENEEWKKYPAAVECFMWILKSLKVIIKKCMFLFINVLFVINVLDATFKYFIILSNAITIEYV